MALRAINADDCELVGQDHWLVETKDEDGHHYHLFEDDPWVPEVEPPGVGRREEEVPDGAGA